MGVLDALGDVNDAVKQGTDFVLDNPALSVQDTVRNTAADLQGKSEEEFAETNSSFWQNISDPVLDPISKEGGDSVLHSAGQGVEVAADLLAGYPVQTANSALTGVEPERRLEEGEDPSTEYAPGAIDTAEVALTVGTGGGYRALSAGGRGAAKAATKAGKVAKAGSKTDMGILSRFTRGAQDLLGSGKKAERTTEVATDYRKIDSSSGVKTTLDDATPTGSKTVDDLTPAGKANKAENAADAANTAENAADASSRGTLGKLFRPRNWLIGGGVAGAGLGLAGQGLPQGYSVERTYQGSPQAKLIRQTDGNGKTLGYWVAINTQGDTIQSLDSPTSKSTVTFPTNRNPPYSSAQEATNAYERWRSEVRNDSNEAGPTSDDEKESSTQEFVWGEVSRIKEFGAGWYLYRQVNNTNDQKRYFVAGYDQNRRLLFLNRNGQATYRSPTPFDNAGNATSAYNAWARRAQSSKVQNRPDPGTDRPNGRTVLDWTRQFNNEKIDDGGGGGGMTIVLALVGGLGLIGAAMYFGVI